MTGWWLLLGSVVGAFAGALLGLEWMYWGRLHDGSTCQRCGEPAPWGRMFCRRCLKLLQRSTPLCSRCGRESPDCLCPAFTEPQAPPDGPVGL